MLRCFPECCLNDLRLKKTKQLNLSEFLLWTYLRLPCARRSLLCMISSVILRIKTLSEAQTTLQAPRNKREKSDALICRLWMRKCGPQDYHRGPLRSRRGRKKNVFYGFPNVLNSNLLTFTTLLVCRLINMACWQMHFHRPTQSKNISAVKM